MVGRWSVGGQQVVGRPLANHLPTNFLRCSLFNITYLMDSQGSKWQRIPTLVVHQQHLRKIHHSQLHTLSNIAPLTCRTYLRHDVWNQLSSTLELGSARHMSSARSAVLAWHGFKRCARAVLISCMHYDISTSLLLEVHHVGFLTDTAVQNAFSVSVTSAPRLKPLPCYRCARVELNVIEFGTAVAWRLKRA